MLQNAKEFAEGGIPFIFDPGQAMPLFNSAELRDFIEQADYVTVNDYESNLLQERTGWDEKQIAQRVKAYIRSEEHTSELQSLMRISSAVFCLKKTHNHKEET